MNSRSLRWSDPLITEGYKKEEEEKDSYHPNQENFMSRLPKEPVKTQTSVPVGN